jgi:hypothetical protein
MSYNNDAVFNDLKIKLETVNYTINELNNKIFLYDNSLNNINNTLQNNINSTQKDISNILQNNYLNYNLNNILNN